MKRSFQEYLVVSKFLLEVPRFKENVLICDALRDFVQFVQFKKCMIFFTRTFTSKNNACGIVSKN